jgi:hypothetical protein
MDSRGRLESSPIKIVYPPDSVFAVAAAKQQRNAHFLRDDPLALRDAQQLPTTEDYSPQANLINS